MYVIVATELALTTDNVVVLPPLPLSNVIGEVTVFVSCTLPEKVVSVGP